MPLRQLPILIWDKNGQKEDMDGSKGIVFLYKFCDGKHKEPSYNDLRILLQVGTGQASKSWWSIWRPPVRCIK